MTTILSASDSRVKKAVGQVIQGRMRFPSLLRDSVEILSSGSKRDREIKARVEVGRL